jgi:hypothetical protein
MHIWPTQSTLSFVPSQSSSQPLQISVYELKPLSGSGLMIATQSFICWVLHPYRPAAHNPCFPFT